MIGDDKTALVEKGSQMLSSLFGGQQQNARRSSRQVFRAERGTGSSLLGIVASVVIGVREPAMPGLSAIFRSLLGGTRQLDKFGGLASTATAAAGKVTRAASSVSSGGRAT